MPRGAPFPKYSKIILDMSLRFAKVRLTTKYVETDEAKIKPLKRLQRAGVAGSPAEMLSGKWIAEGKGKGCKPAREAAEYLDREPALRAEHVLACS